jgi:hypothetical protein
MSAGAFPDTELLLRLYEDERGFSKHHETQRTQSAAILITLSVGLIAIITLDGRVDGYDASVGVVIAILGVFGVFFNRKHYERSRLHLERAYEYYFILDTLVENLKLDVARRAANSKNADRFVIISHVHLGTMWMAMHLVLSLAGVWITIISLRQG